MKNDFLEYYGEHHISPVRQNIDDIEIHYERRKKLYRQCGIPIRAFYNAEILEVGPGGGYNTLAFFHWGCKHIDLVEANPTGIEEMEDLFAMHSVMDKQYKIFPCRIENYNTQKRYDIIIAEGFLPSIYNQKEVISKLSELVAKNGIIVITCSDNVCYFIETLKRLVGIAITADILEYEQKVEKLVDFFSPQLSKLRGVSRSARDWVQDQILNPAGANGMELSLDQAISYFGDEFDILGSSPQMFTDYSWYKDVWYDYKEDNKIQFKRKRLSLLQANMPEVILPEEQADRLVKHFEQIKNLESKYEKDLNANEINLILEEMQLMKELVHKYFDNHFIDVFHESEQILKCLLYKANINMDKYPNFFSAFGRTQQYISFMKK